MVDVPDRARNCLAFFVTKARSSPTAERDKSLVKKKKNIVTVVSHFSLASAKVGDTMGIPGYRSRSPQGVAPFFFSAFFFLFSSYTVSARTLSYPPLRSDGYRVDRTRRDAKIRSQRRRTPTGRLPGGDLFEISSRDRVEFRKQSQVDTLLKLPSGRKDSQNYIYQLLI